MRAGHPMGHGMAFDLHSIICGPSFSGDAPIAPFSSFVHPQVLPRV